MKKTQKAFLLSTCVILSVVIIGCASQGGGTAAAADGFGPGVPLTGELYIYNDESNGGTSQITMETLEIDGMTAWRFNGNTTTSFEYGFVGWGIEPDEAGLELLRSARAVSFNFIGDGKRQTIKIRLSSVRDHAHYEFHFFGEPGVAERVEVSISPMRMFQQPSWGSPVRFNLANAEAVEFQTHESWRPGSFEITVWDIRVHP